MTRPHSPEAWPLGLSAEAAASYLGIGKTTFLSLVKSERLPEGIELAPQTIRWDRDELAAAFKAMKGRRRKRNSWDTAA